MKHTPLLVVAALALAPVAYAQTVITGHHDDMTTGNGIGYSVRDGSYVVPADSGITPSATFNNNGSFGLVIYNAPTVVAGGQFNNNGSDGFYVFDSPATITGGQFSSNGSYGVIFTSSSSGIVSGTISGGTFSGNLVAVEAENNATVTVSGGTFTGSGNGAISSFTGSDVSVTGGAFSSNTYDFYASNGNTTMFPVGVIDIFGSFTDPATGQALTPGQTLSLTGSGAFTGTLANNTTAQSYTYINYAATITLHDVALAAAPEPSQFAAFAIGLLGLGALALKARRRVV